MSNDQDLYLVDVVSGECSFYNVVMVARQLASGYTELSCSQGIYFDINDSLMCECANKFNEYCDDELLKRSYVGFTIETDLTIYIPPDAIEQLDVDHMSVILGGECRLQTCDDASGREHDVAETAFADEFNERFVHTLDTFDDVCNFKVKSIKKL